MADPPIPSSLVCLAQEFQDILVALDLGGRDGQWRTIPTGWSRCCAMPISSSTARDEGRLVGISRAITDFAYCCYLSGPRRRTSPISAAASANA